MQERLSTIFALARTELVETLMTVVALLVQSAFLTAHALLHLFSIPVLTALNSAAALKQNPFCAMMQASLKATALFAVARRALHAIFLEPALPLFPRFTALMEQGLIPALFLSQSTATVAENLLITVQAAVAPTIILASRMACVLQLFCHRSVWEEFPLTLVLSKSRFTALLKGSW